MIKSIINECRKPITAYIGSKQVWQYFTPAELFANGEQGVWFDPSDLSTMFQDVNGVEPVTKDGDPVALIKDKSGNGKHAIQPTASARPIYRTDGILHWLEFDGVDDYLSAAAIKCIPSEVSGLYLGLAVHTSMGNGFSVSQYNADVDSRVFSTKSLTTTRNYTFGTQEAAMFEEGRVVSKAAPTEKHIMLGRWLGGNNPNELAFNSDQWVGSTLAGIANDANLLVNLEVGSINNGSRPTEGNVYSLVVISNGTAPDIVVREYLANKAGVTL